MQLTFQDLLDNRRLDAEEPSLGFGSAIAQEVVQKVQEAAKSLSQSGEAGLAQFDKKENPWVWKDTYVSVLDCAKGTIVAHPFRPG